MTWPPAADQLVRVQEELARADPALWLPSRGALLMVGCFIAFGDSSPDGEPAWAAASLCRGHKHMETVVAEGRVRSPYQPGLLALREGALLEEAVNRLPVSPDVLIVNATGRDHPRRAGLALHLGSVCGLPSIGVTDRPLLARGEWPADERGATSPLLIGDEVVGCWFRSRRGTKPIALSPGWRMTWEASVRVVRSAVYRARTPEPIRRARHGARVARAEAQRTPGAL